MSSVFEALASFSRPAQGSIFYNVPLKEGLSLIMNWSLSCQKGFSSLAHLLQKDFLPMGEFYFIFNVGFNDQTSSESEQFPK